MRPQRSKYDNDEKYKARSEFIAAWRRFSGLYSLPQDRQYWSLCGEQGSEPTSEIEQMVAAGLIVKEQFHGVDVLQSLIEGNESRHRDAHFFCKDWRIALRTEVFRPSLVYLDTKCLVSGQPLLDLLIPTLLAAPADTLIAVNAMVNEPRYGTWHDSNLLIKNLRRNVAPTLLKRWNPENIESYLYQPHNTEMRTFLIHNFSAVAGERLMAA